MGESFTVRLGDGDADERAELTELERRNPSGISWRFKFSAPHADRLDRDSSSTAGDEKHGHFIVIARDCASQSIIGTVTAHYGTRRLRPKSRQDGGGFEDTTYGHLMGLRVSQEHRRFGVASSLLATAENELTKRGCHLILACTSTDNRPSNRLFVGKSGYWNVFKFDVHGINTSYWAHQKPVLHFGVSVTKLTGEPAKDFMQQHFSRTFFYTDSPANPPSVFVARQIGTEQLVAINVGRLADGVSILAMPNHLYPLYYLLRFLSWIFPWMVEPPLPLNKPFDHRFAYPLVLGGGVSLTTSQGTELARSALSAIINDPGNANSVIFLADSAKITGLSQVETDAFVTKVASKFVSTLLKGGRFFGMVWMAKVLQPVGQLTKAMLDIDELSNQPFWYLPDM